MPPITGVKYSFSPDGGCLGPAFTLHYPGGRYSESLVEDVAAELDSRIFQNTGLEQPPLLDGSISVNTKDLGEFLTRSLQNADLARGYFSEDALRMEGSVIVVNLVYRGGRGAGTPFTGGPTPGAQASLKKKKPLAETQLDYVYKHKVRKF